ncbi:uncharacterized protein LOC135931493 isoform X3 [Gordionus sp. m RMFG-2023]|uniref:uncharacterized protein LOC135931493 isoform X3 n=1 Tax=Gordionus sp. m RMFG-2023 TaxID=3053472 RepID=UPI0031FDFCF2
MKVRLAVQVFSSSVAKGILLAQELKIDGFENCESTVDFIQIIDQYLLTYKTSQDHLELFFSCLRSKGGFNNNPSAYQLRSAIRGVMIAKMGALCTDVPDIQKLSPFVDNIATYISGYITRKLISENKVKCYICISAMIVKNCKDQESYNLIKIKNNQGLIIPSRDVSRLCQYAESGFRTFEHNNQIKKFCIFKRIISFVISKVIETNIFDNLVDHMLDQEETSSHYQKLIRLIVERYINISFYHFADKQNKNENTNIRQKLTKTILFKGQ